MRPQWAFLPNALTLTNVLCGSLACFYGAQGSFPLAVALIGLGALADVLDGAVARWLRAESPLGPVLDSLADLVSFGVAPALLLARWAMHWPVATAAEGVLFLLLPFALPLAAAYRLARFAVARPSAAPHFSGLPAPAAGVALATLPLAGGEGYTSTLLGVVVLSTAGLMVSRWPFLAFKSFLARPKAYPIHIVFLTIAGLLVGFLGFRAGLPVLGWYAVCSAVAARFLRAAGGPARE